MSFSALLRIVKVTIDQYVIYRLNFILWRVRVVLNFLIVFFLWSSIYSNRTNALGYSKDAMITYVLAINVVSAIVLSSKAMEVAALIRSGDIINFLLKPISFFAYLLIQEAVDKAINIAFSIVEIGLIVLIFKPHFFIPHSSVNILLAFLFISIGVTLYFFIELGISTLSFWVADIWSARFVFWVLVSILAGTMFPLNILPAPVFNFLLFTPFPYLVYVPIQMYIGTTSLPVSQLFLGGLMWVTVGYFLVRYLWKKGLHEFSFYGK